MLLEGSSPKSMIFNSSCSWYMTGDKSIFVSFEDGKEGSVTFSDGSKSFVIKNGSIEARGILKLDGVLYVERFKKKIYKHELICADKNNSVYQRNMQCFEWRWQLYSQIREN